MGQQRYKPFPVRSRLLQVVLPAPIHNIPPQLVQLKLRRPEPPRRGRLFQRVPARVAVGLPTFTTRRRAAGTPRRVGQFFAPRLVGAYYSPGPLAPSLLHPSRQRLLQRPQTRIWNFPPPNNVSPPGVQALPPSLFRTSERLAYRSPRGRIINYLFPNGLFPVPPLVVPTFRVSRRPAITPARRGKFWTIITVPVPPPGPGPLVLGMTRQAGTSSHYLRPRRGTFAPPPLPFTPPPPPPPPVVGNTDDDIGSSLGRRTWHWKHRAVKSTLPKSLVWEFRNG
jgi:hypothetical protein